MRRALLPVAVAGIALAAALFFLLAKRPGGPPTFRLAPVERGPIASRVSSTGTLNAVVTVRVGSQVSGQIKELLADFNSEVRKDQVIARIAPEDFEARVRQAEADLAVARANVAIQRTAVERARSELQNVRAALSAAGAQTEKAMVVVADAKRDLERKLALHRQAVISQREMDAASATYEQATAQSRAAKAQEQAEAALVASREAQLKMALAQVEHALAQVKHREAVLYQGKVDLEHTIIRSPVDGVVIERSVDIGQTVAASLQAPTLFTIAQDLRKMQVDTSLDEADIGRIRVGQGATFTVDAFAGREFKGRVEQIRKAPQTLQNVVTYTVVVSADNPDLRLLPGMTANVQITVDERSDALKVPNAALRFQPAGNGSESASGSSAGRAGALSGADGMQEARIKRLTEALGLTEEQQGEVRALFAQGRERILALRRQGVTQEDIRAEIERMRVQGQRAIMEFLTPQQRERFRQLVAAREAEPLSRGRVWILGKDGRPQPVEVLAGISDGSFTEIVRGDLQAEQRVIVGMTQPPTKASRGSRRRFGF